MLFYGGSYGTAARRICLPNSAANTLCSRPTGHAATKSSTWTKSYRTGSPGSTTVCCTTRSSARFLNKLKRAPRKTSSLFDCCGRGCPRVHRLIRATIWTKVLAEHDLTCLLPSQPGSITQITIL
ncbi:ketopantoate reductase family protein [Babesia caballi]|uniref:Ketopantoate reductase family protein n=1 Tax=Babesia caballi TaxID=5871 RepID=A0AAV4LVT8_BABCB|nr:ketopantoate reductase family protein [Babesia caballi]